MAIDIHLLFIYYHLLLLTYYYYLLDSLTIYLLT